jgi:UDP-N-acetylmuramate--alanine ligase
VGIKGTGMSALAQITRKMEDALITGSDTAQVYFTDGVLARAGIAVTEFDPVNVEQAEVVVFSPAYDDENVELKRARELELPCYSYPQFLGQMMAKKRGVCIAGTHGKTTTTAMAGKILMDAGLDPCLLVGSDVPCLNGNSHVGDGDFFLVESCEYRRHFLNYQPEFLVITNIELDHPDYFRDLDDVVAAFAEFAGKLPPAGRLIIWEEEPCRAAIRTAAPITTFGFSEAASVRGHDLSFSDRGCEFGVTVADRYLGRLSLAVSGAHNILDALAAIALTLHLGVPPETIIGALTGFNGTRRRFERLGEYGTMPVIDDYAHHPTEIKATLRAARLTFPRGRVRSVFQPHTFSRTARLLGEFAQAFTDADEVIIADIFPSAREKREAQSLSSADLAALIATSGRNVVYLTSFEEIAAYIRQTATEGDILLTLGAGDIYKVGEMVLSTPLPGEPVSS